MYGYRAILFLMRNLLFIVQSIARAHASITICDVYRRANPREFARAFLGVRRDKRKQPRERNLLPRNRTGMLRRIMNVHDSTGLDGNEFNELLQRTSVRIALPRRRAGQAGRRSTAANLLVEDRLFLALVFLRSNECYHDLAREFQVSPAFLSREVRHIVPIICSELHNEVRWPQVQPPGDPDVHGAQGMIDCSAHWRHEIPGDLSWFRRDIAMPNLGVQVVTSLSCEIWDIVFFAGHNNDQGIYTATGMNDNLRRRGIRLLSDMGYRGTQLLRPDDVMPGDNYFEAKHRASRAAIERLFWFNQGWSVAGQICRLPIELHLYAVDATWRLTAWLMRRNPMTPPTEAVAVVDE
jgi:hypothetical protein